LTVPTPFVFLVRFRKAMYSSDSKKDKELIIKYATIINSDVLIQMYSHCKIKYIMQMENMVLFFAELALMQMKTCNMCV
jgi:hypothetical protein